MIPVQVSFDIPNTDVVWIHCGMCINQILIWYQCNAIWHIAQLCSFNSLRNLISAGAIWPPSTVIVWIHCGILPVQVPFGIPNTAVVWIRYGIIRAHRWRPSGSFIFSLPFHSPHSLNSNVGPCRVHLSANIVATSLNHSISISLGKRERVNKNHHTPGIWWQTCVSNDSSKITQCLWGEHVRINESIANVIVLSCDLIVLNSFRNIISAGAIRLS